MSRLSDACHRPFANGTEGESWMAHWCDLCVHDSGAGCDLLLHALIPDEFPWPEAWLPEPDDGDHYLPSRLVCLAYDPGDGPDPGAEDRAERVAEVTAYWREAWT